MARHLTPDGQVALAADPTTTAAVGDTYWNTTLNTLRTCSVAGSPGTWTNSVASSAATPSFASIYKTQVSD